MPVNKASSNDGPASWRAVFNEVFGLDRWSIVLSYTFTSRGALDTLSAAVASANALPKLHVVSVPKRACKIIVQEWPDGGFSYFLETRHFDAGEVRRQLEMWRDHLI